MPNKKPLPAIVVFAIFTTITTFVWIAFDVYRAFTKDPSPTVPEEVIRALDPTIDPDVLSEASGRVHLDDAEIGQTEISIPPEPEPTEAPVETIEETLEELPEDLEETENELQDEEIEETEEENEEIVEP